MKEAILLAAGQSSRMGRDKALLPMGDSTVICHVLDKLLAITQKIYIVLGDNFTDVKNYLSENYPSDQIQCVLNENHLQGMFSSARKGFSVVSGNNPIVFQLIDQPFVSLQIYLDLSETYHQQLIYQPSVKKAGKYRAGHPIIFSPKFVDLIRADETSENLRELINKYNSERAFLEVEDIAILDNLNTPLAFNEKLEKR